MYKDTTSQCSTAFVNIATLISLAIPLTMIVFGGVYMNYCPAEPFIPIYMVGAGGLYVLYALIKIFSSFLHDEEGNAPRFIEWILRVMGFFMFGWFIAGNVWVYRLNNNYSPKYDDTNYCNNSLYLFAFWMITVTYILFAVGILVVCCSFCCMGYLAVCINRNN